MLTKNTKLKSQNYFLLFVLIFLQMISSCLAEVTADVQAVLSGISASKDPNAAAAICKAADEFYKNDKFEQSRYLFQYLVDKYPSSKYAMWAQSGVANSNIALGNDTAAQEAVVKLTKDFKDHRDLPTAIFFLGEHYYKKAVELQNNMMEQAASCYQNAIKIWKILVDKYPKFASTPEACLFIGDSYRQMGKYDKSIEHYKMIVDNYPAYDYAGHALFMMARNYQNLHKKGAMPEAKAESEIRGAFSKLIRDYPNCKAVKYAKRWMNQHNSK